MIVHIYGQSLNVFMDFMSFKDIQTGMMNHANLSTCDGWILDMKFLIVIDIIGIDL